MQGQTVVRIGGRDYLVERTSGGEATVYVTAGAQWLDRHEKPPFVAFALDSHVEAISSGGKLEPGTIVVILARVAVPAEETEEIEIDLEHRYYDERHWKSITWEQSAEVLGKWYNDLDIIRRDLEDGHVIDTDISQYRRVAGYEVRPCAACGSKHTEITEVVEARHNCKAVCKDCGATGPIDSTKQGAAILWNIAYQVYLEKTTDG